jgi:hypothetical protein
MNRFIILAAVVLASANLCAQELTSSEKHAIRAFVNDLKYGRKELIAASVSYPLYRKYPLKPIESEGEFLVHYGEFIDKSFIESVEKGEWFRYGWRGIHCTYENNGVIAGDIDDNGEFYVSWIGFNSVGENSWRDCVERQRKRLYPSLQDFSVPIMMFETIKYTIRIDMMPNETYRYVCWSRKKAISSKPDLIIYNGESWAEGSLHTTYYKFYNGDYSYTISPGNQLDYSLTVSKNGIDLMTQEGHLIYSF